MIGDSRVCGDVNAQASTVTTASGDLRVRGDVNAPASTKVGDTLEFELPASILNEDVDEPGEEEAAEEAPPPAAAPAAAEPPPLSSQKRQSAAASSRLSAFGSRLSSGGRKTRVVSVAGALRNDAAMDEKFTSTRI